MDRLCLHAAFLAAVWSAAAAHGAPTMLGQMGRAAAAAAPYRCATKQDLAAVAALPQLEERVYGRPLAGMNAAQLAKAVRDSAFPSAGITVPIHFHVIAIAGRLGDRTEKFKVTDSVLAKQVAVVNADFKPAGIAFRTASIMWHNNRQWAQSCEDMYRTILQSVGKEPQRALNVLVCDTRAFLGIAPPPPQPDFSEDDTTQGVVISFRTLPGGPSESYNLGHTLTHEIGHWAGLLHVYEGNTCNGPGDGVPDTPVQSEPTSGCPTSKDSCPGQPGRDNIHNFMDYSDDSCMYSFTLGQIARMQAVLLRHRPTLMATATNQARRKAPARRPPPRKQGPRP